MKTLGYLLLLIGWERCWCLDSNNCTIVTNIFESGTTAKNPVVRYFLYTRLNPTEGQQLILNDPIAFARSNFNKLWPIRIMIHGYKGEHMSCANAFVKDAYMQKGDFNMIIMDWSDWSKNSDYSQISKLAIEFLGPALANFTISLTKMADISFDQIYLIGHSLGAHIAGSAGQYAQPQQQYNTIFALDAAGLFFNGKTPDKRIDSTDAQYVESITTSRGSFGYSGEIGHASFFPNYGQSQPHCSWSMNAMCSHLAAVKFFAESINSKIGFCAVPCSSFSEVKTRRCRKPNNQNEVDQSNNLMGGEPAIPKSGIFVVLQTNTREPFAIENCA